MMTFAWHMHHDVLIEPLIERIENRIIYIKTEKAKDETSEQIELRLRLLKIVIGPLPPGWIRAVDEWDKARDERARARDDWDRARDDWYRAIDDWYKTRAESAKAEAETESAKAEAEWTRVEVEWTKAIDEWTKAEDQFKTELETLHKVECPDCPWNGRTIFSEDE